MSFQIIWPTLSALGWMCWVCAYFMYRYECASRKADCANLKDQFYRCERKLHEAREQNTFLQNVVRKFSQLRNNQKN